MSRTKRFGEAPPFRLDVRVLGRLNVTDLNDVATYILADIVSAD
jgi:hypothetical protein